MMQVLDTGALREVVQIGVMVGGVLRDVTQGEYVSTGALRTFYQRGGNAGSISASITPGTLYSRQPVSNMTSPVAACSVAEAAPPISYFWAIEGNDGTVSIGQQGQASTSFGKSAALPGETYVYGARCTAVDATNRSATAYATLIFERLPSGTPQ